MFYLIALNFYYLKKNYKINFIFKFKECYFFKLRLIIFKLAKFLIVKNKSSMVLSAFSYENN